MWVQLPPKVRQRVTKEQGKRIGRPKAVVDIDRILSLRKQGLSLPVCLRLSACGTHRQVTGRQAISDLSARAQAGRVKYRDSRGRWRNVSKGKVHPVRPAQPAADSRVSREHNGAQCKFIPYLTG